MLNYPNRPNGAAKVGIMLAEAYGGENAFGDRQLIIPAITHGTGTPRETIATREWVNSLGTPENMMTTDTAQNITGMKKWYASDNNNYLAIGQDFGNGKCIEIGNSSKSYLTIDKFGIDFGEDSGLTISSKDASVASSTSQITLREERNGYLNLGFDLNKKPRLTIYDTENKVGTKFNNSNINHYDDDLGTSYTYSYPSASGTLATQEFVNAAIGTAIGTAIGGTY